MIEAGILGDDIRGLPELAFSRLTDVSAATKVNRRSYQFRDTMQSAVTR